MPASTGSPRGARSLGPWYVTGERTPSGMTTGTTAAGGGGTGSVDPDLVFWYKFDDAAGTSALDSSGNGRNAILSSIGGGTAAFSTTSQVGSGSLDLNSASPTTGGFAAVPTSLQVAGTTTAITIACWVNVRTQRAWQKVFDFGSSSTTRYVFLTTQQAATTPNSPRLAITNSGNASEQDINMTTPALLSTGVWQQLAVVLGTGTTYTGTLYLDGAVAGTNTAMTLRPSDLGNTPNNWIGRSQFSADPLFDGFVDDFRVYKRALSASEIAALVATP